MEGGDRSAMLILLRNDFPIFGDAGREELSSHRDDIEAKEVMGGIIIIIEDPVASPGELRVPLQ
jgi:hypothetical protein